MNEPKICPAGGRQGAQVMEHWGSDATQWLGKGSLYVFINFILFYVFTCLLACRGQKRSSQALDLVVRNHMELGIKPGSSASTANALSHGAISLAPR